MNKFNLIEEPWIPCLMLKNNETKDLSLFEVLSKAHEIKEICLHISGRKGGEACVRDIVEQVMRSQGTWEITGW